MRYQNETCEAIGLLYFCDTFIAAYFEALLALVL